MSNAETNYKARVEERIETLMPVLAQAAVGDFSHDVPLNGPHDQFSELYVGVQLMLEVIREKLSQLEQLNAELESLVAARTTELYGSETRFTAVADTANDAIITIDQRGAITYLNHAAEIIFGRTLNQATHQSLATLIPDLSPEYLTALPAPPSTGSKKLRKLIQTTAIHRNGHKFPVELSIATWKVGDKMFSTVIVRDLTVHQMLIEQLAQKTEQLEARVVSQTKQLRQQLAETEKNQAEDEALLGSIGEGVVAMDKAGRIFYANQEFTHLTGTRLEDIKGQHFYSTITVEDAAGKPVPKAGRPITHALKSGRRLTNTDLFFRTAENRVFPVSVTAAPIILKGKVIGGIDIIRDITKEKEVDRLKSEFVSLASHQLRTPATAVKGLLSLLLEGYSGNLTPVQTDNLQQAFTENEHELRLIDDMLDAAKFDAGEIVLEKKPINLAHLIKMVVDEQGEQLRTRRQTVRVAPARATSLRGDPEKLRMVFENLLTNASKYSPAGSKIDISIEHSSRQLSVHIRDQGIGILAKDIPNLFRRFSRGSNASEHAEGSGLGLYLAKKIIDLHHGRIEVTSVKDQGSTFTVVLPKV